MRMGPALALSKTPSGRFPWGSHTTRGKLSKKANGWPRSASTRTQPVLSPAAPEKEEGEGSVDIESRERPRDPPPTPSRSRPRPHPHPPPASTKPSRSRGPGLRGGRLDATGPGRGPGDQTASRRAGPGDRRVWVPVPDGEVALQGAGRRPRPLSPRLPGRDPPATPAVAAARRGARTPSGRGRPGKSQAPLCAPPRACKLSA